MYLYLLVAVCLVFSADIGETQTVEVGTRYVTSDVQTASQQETGVYIATTCNQLQGSQVNVTVLLNNNPTWTPDFGVIYFYVVDSRSKTENDSLCTNHPAGKPASPYCLVQSWNSTNLYVKTTAGEVAAVSFTVNVQFIPKAKGQELRLPLTQTPKNKAVKFPLKQAADYYLTEIVHLLLPEHVTYHDHVMLNVTFCPNPETTDTYTIESIVFSVDQISSYTQYICDALPCEVDGPNVKYAYGKQLPSNTIIVSATHGEWKQLYVLIVGWGGNFDPAVKNYVGQFEYSASIQRIR